MAMTMGKMATTPSIMAMNACGARLGSVVALDVKAFAAVFVVVLLEVRSGLSRLLSCVVLRTSGTIWKA